MRKHRAGVSLAAIGGREPAEYSRTMSGARVLLLLALVGTFGLASVGTIRHHPVILIVMENRSYQSIVGSPSAPFINQTLIRGGRLYTNYMAGLGSLPDYLVMVAGSPAPSASAPSLFTALGARTPWREFMESMPTICDPASVHGRVSGRQMPLYLRYHNPAMYFRGVSRTPLCRNVVPLNASHFAPAALPPFSLVVPNQCDNMHTQPVNNQCPMWNGKTNTAPNPTRMGDNWLAAFVPAVAKVATVIITWDEGRPSNEHVLTLAYGAGVRPGRDASAYSHSALEAGLYAHFGLGRAPGSGAAVTALPIP
jgi:phosphatidylinositol-3-phosphatase